MSNLAEKYYEGQEVRLECVASKYKYSRVTWTMKNAECSRRMDERRQQLHEARGGDTAASSEDRAQLIRICEVGGEARDTEHAGLLGREHGGGREEVHQAETADRQTRHPAYREHS